VNPEFEKIIAPLRAHAARLDAMAEPSPTATVFYEVMSGALVWSDEKIKDVPTQVIWSLRPLWAFRSSVISGAPAEKWRLYWDACVALFPRWIGFRPERMKSSPELLKILEDGRASVKRELERP
jgi:hypothetical protein